MNDLSREDHNITGRMFNAGIKGEGMVANRLKVNLSGNTTGNIAY
jgi:hypothetical protein